MKAKIWNFNGWITETEPRALASIFDTAVHAAGFGVLGTSEHFFTPQGYTKLYLLCESHFALHTFPEEGKTYIELSSCNGQKYEAFLQLIEPQVVFLERSDRNGTAAH